MKRAKLRGLTRNAAVVLGIVGTTDHVDVRMRALDDEEPLLREHAASALSLVERRQERALGITPFRCATPVDRIGASASVSPGTSATSASALGSSGL